ncbi:hypothetical protein B0T21DRAFT_373096 [Apiosordaria backusii]|uniref:Uncharacterized protein n=1 Tax=Apiosordaria backusii TaxID=314023 RepID=A0AA40DYJ1_9PEZI|nr:hypothetical protein B0T21DRAFT_373096 [Apiosordaria backusii]
MAAAKTGGNIILVSSQLSTTPIWVQRFQGSCDYGEELSRRRVAQHGIRVNTISPGYVNTILNEGEGLDDAKRI